jgi:hypothetical protein
MKKNKAITKYDSTDIAEIITGMFLNIESPDGVRFKALQITKDTVIIKINYSTFIINISDKQKLS